MELIMPDYGFQKIMDAAKKKADKADKEAKMSVRNKKKKNNPHGGKKDKKGSYGG
tara:strand:+ start:411 stop:575 length:165 start_codon:yes stop_codon:yes gene_type:complete